MKVSNVSLRNFRRLEDIQFNLEQDHTVFVGPNNSGKTSVTAAFRLFLKRNEFSISDFTVARITDLNRCIEDTSADADSFPAIEMDIWLSIDPNVEFGRVFSLLPNVSTNFEKVGMRLRYCVKDVDLLRTEFNSTFPTEDGKRQKNFDAFLSLPNMLSRHFATRFFALELEGGVSRDTEIEADEGRRVLHSLIRVDFIDAQRNIHDHEGGRQNRLSAAFAAYYMHNLEKPSENIEANKVINDNNSRLTEHYKTHFEPLLKNISILGVPSALDRSLDLVSSMSAQDALRGSTELFYVDTELQHRLPEAYNGLGFKNLVYMAIQISHFHAQWLSTEKGRELCQLIFIEEPEVHLHAQVQQIFITNIWNILKETAKNAEEEFKAPQLAISTHSSHIVDTVAFEKIRYFRRCRLSHQAKDMATILNATKVLNLQDFKPDLDKSPKLSANEAALSDQEKAALIAQQEGIDRRATINFLKKYLKLTHCDLFFADAAILVEGTVEKLLLPQMIDECAKELQSRYLTVLEVGGAYAHKLASLLDFLGIPYLIITDIDTIDPGNNRSACRADTPGSHTSNAALKHFLEKDSREELISLKADEQIVSNGSCFVAFQRPASINLDNKNHEFHGRTLEEAFIYENLPLFKSGQLDLKIDFTKPVSADQIRDEVYELIKSDGFKKTEFALGIVSSSVAWKTPAYIAEGLRWLEKKLAPQAAPQPAIKKEAI